MHAARSDSERDGLRGPVERVRVEAAERVRGLTGWEDAERTVLEEVAYDAEGRRLEWVFFDDEGAPERRYGFRALPEAADDNPATVRRASAASAAARAWRRFRRG